MKRRTLLLGGGAALATGYGAIMAAGATQGCMKEGGEMALSESAQLASLGMAYLALASAPERVGLAELARRPAEVIARYAALLSARAQEDFAADDVVTCDGWVITRGEARACALVALSQRTGDGGLAIFPMGSLG